MAFTRPTLTLCTIVYISLEKNEFNIKSNTHFPRQYRLIYKHKRSNSSEHLRSRTTSILSA